MSQDQLDARREEILAGARACFARYGYEGATVRRLEEETGLSRGAIFHHFRDKESLFLAVAEDDAAAMVATVARNGLVQVMRDLLHRAAAPTFSAIPPSASASARASATPSASASAPPSAPPSASASASASRRGTGTSNGADATDVAGWLGTQLEVSRRLRTDPAFAKRWSASADAIGAATRDRLARQRDAGVLRADVDVDVLAQFLELAYDGLVLHLAMGRPIADLEHVLDLVESAVRR